ncbi:hypothetical protein Prum_000100 [Phytohabitans rumicis]|uniref:Uncharacterized protein n=1 Tax=Phytohabitans rumicis TaxID=1076125 RepID=A0A6V8KUI5_9ACTN|nr:hypothetical protein Prum_000100 [Phytohabitans rumicis]
MTLSSGLVRTGDDSGSGGQNARTKSGVDRLSNERTTALPYCGYCSNYGKVFAFAIQIVALSLPRYEPRDDYECREGANAIDDLDERPTV